MPKRSVYLPQDLVDGLAERPDIKVSEVCQEALRAALGEVAQSSTVQQARGPVGPARAVDPVQYHLAFAKTSTLATTLAVLAERGVLVAVSHDGADHVIVWREP